MASLRWPGGPLQLSFASLAQASNYASTSLSTQSRRRWGLWWAYPPKQSSKPPKLKYDTL